MKSQAGRSLAALGLALALCVRGGAALAQQPSLVELAQKEHERKKTVKTAPSKVFTDKDLPKPTAPPPVASTVPPVAPTPVPAEQKPAEDKKDDQNDEASWRTRMTQAREALRRAEAFADALQSRINALATDMVNRDDPYQRAKIAEDRQKALAELQRVQTEIEQAKKDISGIEEEARRAGVPPGWIR
jgi:DNA repair exonuclease SbcCD ATPase subunit